MNPVIFIGISVTLILAENFTSAANQSDNTSESNPPALTCVVIGDTACDRMCKMVGHIYASPVNQAKCDASNNCECSMRQHTFLDDLWKEKFSSTELLDTIKVNRQHYEDILSVMQTPFQTREQTKNTLEWFLDPKYFQQIKVNDNVSQNMIKDNGRGAFDHDNIRAYVNRNLQSDPLQLPTDFCFKTRLRNALQAPAKETVQYIINDVRRSKNAVLNEIVDTFIKETNFTGSDDDDDDDDDDETLTDILDLMIVDQFITPSPISNYEAAASTSTPTQENNALSEEWDFELPNLDVPSVKEFNDGYKCWDNEKPSYRVCQFKAEWGEHQVWWKKGKDSATLTVQDTGEIVQEWKFDNVKINISRKKNGDLEQIWNFSQNSQLLYIKSGDAAEQIWANDKEDEEALAKYRSVIDLWCDKNSIFISRELCAIY